MSQEKAGKPFKNVYVLRFISKYLFSKERARVVRYQCQRQLDPNETLIINAKGIKDITGGFAYDAFGLLYVEAKKRGCRIRFFGMPEPLKPIVLRAIKAAIEVNAQTEQAPVAQSSKTSSVSLASKSI